MYYLPEPPYFLLVAGLFIGITCGVAFEATLKEAVNGWMKVAGKQPFPTGLLQLPFLGICVGICVFLASGLEIFILDRWFAYSIAFPVTLFTGALVWTQLGKLLEQLKAGGSKALDLDAF